MNHKDQASQRFGWFTHWLVFQSLLVGLLQELTGLKGCSVWMIVVSVSLEKKRTKSEHCNYNVIRPIILVI